MLRVNQSSKDIEWNDEAKASFNNLKQALAICPPLSFPNLDVSEYDLVTDSSSYAIGGALYQMSGGQSSLISFYSKKLSSNYRILSIFDRELLAAFTPVVRFRHLIDGNKITLFMDHKPVVSAFYSSNIPKSDEQQGQLTLIFECVSRIEYNKGDGNIVADCLSRPVCATSVDAFNLSTQASA